MAVRKQNEIAVSIPFDKIKRIQIYENQKGKSLATIMKETGADYAINGTLYNMRTRNAVCPLRIDGVTKFAGPYKYFGYAWNTDMPMSFRTILVPDYDWDNWIACSRILRNGTVIENMIYNSAMGGSRGRTAIGIKFVNGERRLCFYVSADRNGYRRTPQKLAQLLERYGWDDAIMLDGGGSSQGYFKKEKRQVYSSRRVAHYILVYMKG